MIVITNNFKFRKWFKYGLKSNHPTEARPEGAEALSPGQRKKSSSLLQHALKGQKLLAQDCYGHKQHALNGQKLLVQGNALGIMTISNAPCKGKSFKNSQNIL